MTAEAPRPVRPLALDPKFRGRIGQVRRAATEEGDR